MLTRGKRWQRPPRQSSPFHTSAVTPRNSQSVRPARKASQSCRQRHYVGLNALSFSSADRYLVFPGKLPLRQRANLSRCCTTSRDIVQTKGCQIGNRLQHGRAMVDGEVIAHRCKPHVEKLWRCGSEYSAHFLSQYQAAESKSRFLIGAPNAMN